MTPAGQLLFAASTLDQLTISIIAKFGAEWDTHVLLWSPCDLSAIEDWLVAANKISRYAQKRIHEEDE